MTAASANIVWKLHPDEHVRWQGRPDGPTAALAATVPGVFGAVWIALVTPVVSRALKEGKTTDVVVGALFLLLGIILLCVPLYALLTASRAGYAITNRRLIFARLDGATLTSIPLANIKQVTSHTGRGGRTTLKVLIGDSSDRDVDRKVDYVFYGVLDGDRAYRLLTDPRQA